MVACQTGRRPNAGNESEGKDIEAVQFVAALSVRQSTENGQFKSQKRSQR